MASNIFYVHPYLGNWSILTNIFQVGWNHQLVEVFLDYLRRGNYTVIIAQMLWGFKEKQIFLEGPYEPNQYSDM